MDTMLDTNQDVRPLLGHLGLVGCRIVARYSHQGATDAQGNVPQPVATTLTQTEAKGILAVGLGVLLIGNNIGKDDCVGPFVVTTAHRKAAEIQAAAEAIGYPKGCLVAIDLETWDVDPDFMRTLIHALIAVGYAVMLYGSAVAGWRSTWEQVSPIDAACNCPCWTARYVGGAWTGTLPAWDPQDDGGSNTLAWQFTDRGPDGIDLSEIQPPLLGKVWTPQATTPAPAPAPTPATPTVDVAAALAQLRKIAAEIQATESSLGA